MFHLLILAAFTYFMIQFFGFHRYSVEEEGNPFFNSWVSRFRNLSDPTEQ